MRKVLFLAVFPAVLAVSACQNPQTGVSSGAPPAISALETAAAVVTPERIDTLSRTVDLAAASAKLAIAAKVVTPGSRTALTIADGLDAARSLVNQARELRRAGDIVGAARAFARGEAKADDINRALTALLPK